MVRDGGSCSSEHLGAPALEVWHKGTREIPALVAQYLWQQSNAHLGVSPIEHSVIYF